ncbi:MAG TPA: glycosyltransferase, partial [Phycisphaerae bacterium]|nr:glycosyltransferase [Phycisphaerae bacterium]
MTRPIYIFAGGGTGGHLYPGLAVAEQLERLDRGAQVVFACSNRPIDRRILDPLDYPVVPQPVRPLPRNPKGWIGFLKAWRRSIAQASQMIADLTPVAVLGLGGFAAGPLVRRAARVGVPTALLNPDAVPGKANRYLAKHADIIFSQFDSARERFGPGARQKVRCVGCPVRSSFLSAERPEALRHFDLRTDRKTLLVNGGSLGARLINDAVLGLKGDLAALSEAWQVLHVTGPDRYAEVGGAWKTAGIHTRVLPYCDRMDLAYAAADLVVGRCGASTAAELAATATPAA